MTRAFLIAAPVRAFGVLVYDVDAEKARVVSDERLVSYVQWLPDSRRLLLLTNDGHLVLIDAESGRRRVLDPGGSFNPSTAAMAHPTAARCI